MKKNVGFADRSFRIVLAVVLAILYFTGVISGTMGIIGGVAAIVLLLTALVGTCPLYLALGVSTEKTE